MKHNSVILYAVTSEHFALVKELFLEYERSLPFDLDFQNFDEEVSHLPGEYSTPEGRILIALAGGKPAGCVALRKHGEGVCEMKRLYVRPEFRGEGIGKTLAGRIIAEAKKIGYEKMRLDTVGSMVEAIALYRSFGFKEIGQYRVNPLPGAIFFELDLK
ncbi:MAG: GNAT family N-acetyltransferase [Bacteroidetes bacterium]|nr:GNAT family N-acetyltransferase [Bacteroidota bacterium]